jgi:putative transposase
MATDKIASPESFLKSCVPADEIRRAAHRLGVVRRRRKVDPVALLMGTVLVLCGRGGQSLAGMRRQMALRFGLELARSSFWNRFTKPFEALVTWLLERLQTASKERPPVYTGLLRGFRDVVAVDSTVIKVDDRLARTWTGTRKTSAKAALKIHTFVRAVTGELLRHRITPETRADSREFALGHWANGMLFLFDRGYRSASLWWRAHRLGGYFVTRLSANYKPTITDVNRRHRGRARGLAGRPLREALVGLKRSLLDVQCRFNVRVRPYGRAKGRRFTHDFRVVGVWDSKRKCYALYVTNIPPERLSPDEIAEVYRLRWEVETFYKAGKSGLGLHELGSSKPHIVRTLVKAALIRASIAMQAKCAAEQNLPPGRWINPHQWVQVWRIAIEALVRPLRAGLVQGYTWCQLALTALDPNLGRPPTRWRCLHTETAAKC